MAGLGKKTWNALDVLTAADMNGYLMDQAVMKFASAAARSSAIGTGVSSGMVSFRSDGTAWEGYNGTSWVPLVSVDTSSFITASSTATLTNKTISGDQIVSLDVNKLTTSVNTVTGAYTAVVGDRNETIIANSGSAFTITVPDLFNIGDRIDIIRDGAGTVSIAAGTGVSTWAGAGTAGAGVTFKIDQQYNGATVQKVAANSYRVIGKIVP